MGADSEPVQHEIREQLLGSALAIAVAALEAVRDGRQHPKDVAERALGMIDTHLTAH